LEPEVLENDIAHFIPRAESYDIGSWQPVTTDLMPS